MAPRRAHVIAVIALFVAGGSATAARLISGRSIKNNSVTGRTSATTRSARTSRTARCCGATSAAASSPPARRARPAATVRTGSACCATSRGLHRGANAAGGPGHDAAARPAPTRPAATPTSTTTRARSSTTASSRRSSSPSTPPTATCPTAGGRAPRQQRRGQGPGGRCHLRQRVGQAGRDLPDEAGHRQRALPERR